MKKYKIKINGIQPIIWNVLKREIELEKKELKKNELAEWEEDEDNWKKKAEFNEAGEVICPARWFKNCIIESCKKNRIIPHFENRKNATYTYYIQSCMVFDDGKKICDSKDLEPFGAFVGAQGKGSTTKVWRVRPMLKKWEYEFRLIDPSGRMKIEELKEIIDYAGLMVGLGDNRVNNYGRFELKKVEEEK